MKVFLSWSGDRSKAVATALNDLLPAILQPITCWMSEGGIAKGKPWFDQLSSALDGILFGVFCVTPENRDSVWMQWEAGFLSSTSAIGDRHVAPLAIGMSKGSLSGPFAIYQGTDCEKEDLFRLVRDINSALHEDKRVPLPTLERTFGYVWPELEKRIAVAAVLPQSAPAVLKVSEGERLAQEGIALMRDNQREMAETKAMVTQLVARSFPATARLFTGFDPTNPAGGLATFQRGVSDLVFGGSNLANAAETNTPLPLRAKEINLPDNPALGGGLMAGPSLASDKK